MTTTQIIMFSFITLLYMFLAGSRISKEKDDDKRTSSSIEILLFLMTMIVLIAITFSLNELQKGVKCPEYEKIENVYKLKE